MNTDGLKRHPARERVQRWAVAGVPRAMGRGMSGRCFGRVLRGGGLGWFAGLGLAAVASLGQPAPLLDDRAVTVGSVRDVTRRREALIDYLWGSQGFPRRRPEVVLTQVSLPIRSLRHVARVDEFRVGLAVGLEGVAYHFMAERPNRELVVVHQGHACTLEDPPGEADPGYGLQRTLQALLREGYGVLGVYMPRYRPGDCTGGHETLFQTASADGSPIRWFLETTAVSLNHLRTQSRPGRFPKYRRYHMVGLSGGGWTITVYAAIDPKIQCSFPVAGTIPLYLRSGGSVGDREQYERTFYERAGYPDLYVLGAQGKGRRQVQVLVRRDDCCFGEAQHDERGIGMAYADAMRLYEGQVQAVLARIGRGSFRLEIDESAPRHMISSWTIEHVILPELRSARVSTAP